MKREEKEKILLAIIHTLLNSQTQIPVSNKTVISVMNAIERKTPLSLDVWHKKFEIVYEGKTIFKWNNGTQSFTVR